MTTINELKKNLKVGDKLKLVYRQHCEDKINSMTEEEKIREIVAFRSKDLQLRRFGSDKPSTLDIPQRSNLCVMEGNTLSIYLEGERDLTPEEKAIMDNEPKDEKQDNIDMITDGSTMFWRRKYYYKEHNADYLFVGEKQRGMRRNCNNNKIWDERVRGELSLKYEVVLA